MDYIPTPKNVSASPITRAQGVKNRNRRWLRRWLWVSGAIWLVGALVIGLLVYGYLPTGPIAKVRKVNAQLPGAQVQAKTFIYSSHMLGRIPDATNWCEALNPIGKFWRFTPSNTVFAINSQAAGRAFADLPGDMVVFFETSGLGWNQAGGSELLAKKSEGAAVAFADGRALIVAPGESTSLRWGP
jgi:hypothetical protein